MEQAELLSGIICIIIEDVIKNRLITPTLEAINLEKEQQECIRSKKILAYIDEFANDLFNKLWFKNYSNKWLPKTNTILEKEKNPSTTVLNVQKRTDNHYISRRFIKKYWAKNNFITLFKYESYRLTKTSLNFGLWGHIENIYSDQTEAYFGLLESDAGLPIKKLIMGAQINRVEKEAIIGFIVIHYLRNPHTMERIKNKMLPIIQTEIGKEAADADYLKKAYETIYRNNEFYAKFATTMIKNYWVLFWAFGKPA